jgi:agmatine deiminase
MHAGSNMNSSDSYRMPAEWEDHEGTWLAWPHNEEHWPGNFAPIPNVYATIVRELALREKVFVCVNNGAMEEQARQELKRAEITSDLWRHIVFFHIPTNASWSRDHGPIFVKNQKGQIVITDWIFNSWGGKYPPWELDDVVPQQIGKMLNIPVVQPGIVLEGGSIDVNGKGTLLTTEQCLLNENRNPHLNRLQIEECLRRYLGTSHVLWLKEGIIGDDTDGHIDDLARFVNERTVVCVLEENSQDENFEILKRNYEDLKSMRDQDGELLRVVSLPMPAPVFHEGNRLPASYANFYIANRAVLVPTFRCSQDQNAIDILKTLFPGRDIVGIDCVDLVWGLGTLHCSTQQQPAA